MDVRSGHIIANISMLSGIDRVAYSANTNAFLNVARGMTIDGRNGSIATPLVRIRLTQTIPTYDSVLAHPVSVDESDGKIFVPIRQLGITVFSQPRHPHGRN
jgi:hypothetical protein